MFFQFKLPLTVFFLFRFFFLQVFCELERVLDSELDFRAEAQAMEKIAAGVAHSVDGSRARPPIVVPRPVPGLCSGRVLVMEYVQVRGWWHGIMIMVMRLSAGLRRLWCSSSMGQVVVSSEAFCLVLPCFCRRRKDNGDRSLRFGLH